MGPVNPASGPNFEKFEPESEESHVPEMASPENINFDKPTKEVRRELLHQDVIGVRYGPAIFMDILNK